MKTETATDSLHQSTDRTRNRMSELLSIQLLDCPFCGGNPIVSGVYDEDERRRWCVKIECANCGVFVVASHPYRAHSRMTPEAEEEALRGAAADIWNTRQTEDRIAALEAALQKAERERDEARGELQSAESDLRARQNDFSVAANLAHERGDEVDALRADNATLRAQVAGLRAKLEENARACCETLIYSAKAEGERRTLIMELRAKVDGLAGACRRVLPEWEIPEDDHDGHVACEISNGDVRAIKAALARCQPASAADTHPQP